MYIHIHIYMYIYIYNVCTCDQKKASRIRGFKLWWWLYCADFEVLVPCLMQGMQGCRDAGMQGCRDGWDHGGTMWLSESLTRNH